jgi:hypothetical protein
MSLNSIPLLPKFVCCTRTKDYRSSDGFQRSEKVLAAIDFGRLFSSIDAT